jgi:murein DD-endopeptidase MepM/ murein hydrolase activator NlpD
VTPEKMRFFNAWAQAEGTQAQYNPFATTRKGYQGETAFNSVGVKNYPDVRTGIKATIDTLSLGYYTHIVDLLRDPNATAEQLAKAVAASPWGTGTGVLRVLGVADVEGYEKATSTAKYGAKKAQLESQYSQIDAVSFRPSEAYVQQVQRLNPALGRLVAEHRPLGQGLSQRETKPAAQFVPSTPDSGYTYDGKKLNLPTSWGGTHVTDGLGWGSNTAEDIMGDPGTPLGAPEAGTVIYFHPTGAQGGGSMLFRTASGREYWLGHIDQGIAAGTQVKRGQQIAVISGDHAAPHVHIDRRDTRARKRKK